MAEKQDYYSVLGVDKNATDKEIRKSYLTLSKKWHPDMQHGKSDAEKKEAEEKFKTISEAYDVLSNKDKRARYDQFGFSAPEFGGNGGGSGFDMGDFFRRHGSMFGSFFGSGFNPFGNFGDQFGEETSAQERMKPDFTSPVNGESIKVNIGISLKESLLGCIKEFDVKLNEECPECHGAGCKDLKSVKKCNKCKGSGREIHQVQSGFMTQIIERECNECQGLGYVFDKCPKCGGSGTVPKQKHIKFKIPAGIQDGQKIRISGSGMCGVRGGSNGDMIVVAFSNKDPSDKIVRVGAKDVRMIWHVDPVTATIGGDIDVPLLNGKMTSVKVPAGSDNGTDITLKGKGINGEGDLHIVLNIEPLKKLSKSQKKILDDLKKTINGDNCPEAKRDLDHFNQLMK